MTTRDEVYHKFGNASEAAQLLEKELGNLLLYHRASSEGLVTNRDPERAGEILRDINRSTLGRLVRGLANSEATIPELEEKLEKALAERNRLAHSFFREHNFRINSAEGRSIMYQDLERMHETIFDAYRSLIEVVDGIDLNEEAANQPLPTKHVKI